MLLTISHKTTYAYDQPVDHALQKLRLTPKSGHGQTIQSWNTTVDGGSVQLEYDDQHNNHVQLVSVDRGVESIVIHSSGTVETRDLDGIIGNHFGFAPLWYFKKTTPLTKAQAGIRALTKSVGDHDSELATMHALSAEILEQVTYQTGETDALTTAEEALAHGYGVCQDHAHLFLAAARHMGFPARYVSGYLMMNDRIEQAASHAWAEAHVDALGWVGFDISNGISPDERYVRVATGLDYNDAAPIQGMRYGPGDESLVVSLQVQQ